MTNSHLLISNDFCPGRNYIKALSISKKIRKKEKVSRWDVIPFKNFLLEDLKDDEDALHDLELMIGLA